MEDRRTSPNRGENTRSTARRRPETAAPRSVLDEIPWRAVVPVIALMLLSAGAWSYSQNVSIDDVPTEPINYAVQLRTPLLSARRVPETLQQPLADEALAPEIAKLLSGSGPNACLIVEEDNRILNVTNPRSSLVPASNQKLVLTSALLSQYGPDHTFTTIVTASAPVVDGVMDGNLYLIGGGDPFLATDDWRAQYGDDQEGRATTSLEDLADSVAATGITRITGAVQGDESFFDSVRYGPWAERLIASNQSGPLSALSVNEGFTSWPQEFAGSFRARTQAPDPALNAAEVFIGLLAGRNVTVEGGALAAPAPTGLITVASIESPPLLDIVTHVNSYSNNHGAEMLVKYLGRTERSIGTTEAGVAVIRSILEVQRFDLGGVRIDDGSGLAETDRLTCTLLADILERAGAGSPLARTLSIGGERGSLLERHEGTPADGNVFAKTGTLNGVTALSGIVESAKDPETDLIFTYIVNGESVGLNETVKGLQEPFVEALAAYPNAPLLTELGPLQP